MWIRVSNGKTVGTKGSENGTIIIDEEYGNSCRITLEKCSKYYAITCCVYGAMVHTAFCVEYESMNIYTQMKDELQSFVDGECSDDDFYERFTNKY